MLIAITRTPDPEVIFIKRGEFGGSHSGQVAFPGGMWESGDRSLIHTALRESEEEIALPPSQVELIAALEPRTTRYDVRVSPFLGFIPEGLELVPELRELDAIFQVPISYLVDAGNYTRTKFSSHFGVYDAPCIYYEDYCIWGLTYGVLVEMLSRVFGLQLGCGQAVVMWES